MTCYLLAFIVFILDAVLAGLISGIFIFYRSNPERFILDLYFCYRCLSKLCLITRRKSSNTGFEVDNTFASIEVVHQDKTYRIVLPWDNDAKEPVTYGISDDTGREVLHATSRDNSTAGRNTGEEVQLLCDWKRADVLIFLLMPRES